MQVLAGFQGELSGSERVGRWIGSLLMRVLSEEFWDARASVRF